MKVKSCLVFVAITTLGAWAPQAFSRAGETSTCYGMFQVQLYHCLPSAAVLNPDGTVKQPAMPGVVTAVPWYSGAQATKQANGNYPAGTVTAYMCMGTSQPYTTAETRNQRKTNLTSYAPTPIVPTSTSVPNNGGVNPASPDPRSAIVSPNKIFDTTDRNRYPEKGAVWLKDKITASNCHAGTVTVGIAGTPLSKSQAGGYGGWNSKMSAMCGYALPLSAYTQAGMPQGTFTIPEAQANDYAVIIGLNTIWKDDTNPKGWSCPPK